MNYTELNHSILNEQERSIHRLFFKIGEYNKAQLILKSYCSATRPSRVPTIQTDTIQNLSNALRLLEMEIQRDSCLINRFVEPALNLDDPDSCAT